MWGAKNVRLWVPDGQVLGQASGKGGHSMNQRSLASKLIAQTRLSCSLQPNNQIYMDGHVHLNGDFCLLSISGLFLCEA